MWPLLEASWTQRGAWGRRACSLEPLRTPQGGRSLLQLRSENGTTSGTIVHQMFGIEEGGTRETQGND